MWFIDGKVGRNAKVLRDNARLLQMLREGVDMESELLDKIDDLLALKDILENHFGTDKKAG
jgi:hypothetical protein